MIDTHTQAAKAKPQYRGLAEKLQIVSGRGVGGGVARLHGVNANLVFNWRKLAVMSDKRRILAV
jgi:hypothetical protein